MEPQGPQPLTTERVSNNRRAPIAVGIAIIAIVGLLVWRPWAASPLTSPLSSPSPSPLVFAPRPTPSPNMTPSAPPEPTQITIQTDVGTIVDPGFAVFQCATPGPDGSSALTSIALGGPTVQVVFDASDVRFLSWHVEIEANRIDKVFEAPWQTVLASDPQVLRLHGFDLASFEPVQLEWDMPGDPLTVLRPAFVIEWQARGHATIGSAKFMPLTIGVDPAGFSVEDGCSPHS